MTTIDAAFVKKYFTDNYRHPAYKDTVELYDSMRIHFNGEYPAKLIDTQRPNEGQFSKDYRKTNYRAKTKAICTRITNTISKTRRSPDWVIKFPPETSAIQKEESLEQYINYKYPFFTSLTMWLFGVLVKNYEIDSNAVCCVIPLENIDPEDVETYPKPFPFIYNSPQVIDYVENELCVLESKEKCTYVYEQKTYYDGKVVIVLTDTQYIRYEQVDTSGKMNAAYFYDHNIGELPAFKLRGIFKENIGKETIWESRLSGILPWLDSFVTMDSDLGAEIALHVYPEKWVWGQSQKCQECNGTGYQGDNINKQCPVCHGTKKIILSPFNVTNVEPADLSLGKQPAPIPPLGYISKTDVEGMTKLLNELLKEASYNALSAINFEHLAEVPLVQSGVAKRYDSDEANNTMHSLCEDIVWIADKICYFTNEYRNTNHVTSKEQRLKLLPQIPVPETYDLLNTNALLMEMQAAIASKMPAAFINKLAVEIASKKYPNDPDFIDMMECVSELDPFPSFTKDELISLVQNKFIEEKYAVISANIQPFVKRAIFEDPHFVVMELDKRQETMLKYAQEVIDANDVSKALLPGPGNEPINPNPQPAPIALL